MLKKLRGWHVAALVAASAILAVTVQSAFAGSSQAPLKGFGHTVIHVNTVSDDPATTPVSIAGAELPVPGAVTTLTTNSGDLLFIRFTAQSFCSGAPGPTNFCSVRILVDGSPIAPLNPPQPPAPGTPQNVFDSAQAVGTSAGGERSIEGWVVAEPTVTGSESHTISVVQSTSGGTVKLTLSNWTLTVEQAS